MAALQEQTNTPAEVAMEEGEASNLLAAAEQEACAQPRRLNVRRPLARAMAIIGTLTSAVVIVYSVNRNTAKRAVVTERSASYSNAFLVARSSIAHGHCGGVEEGIDYNRNASWGGLVGLVHDPSECCDKCHTVADCISWSWSNNTEECWLGKRAPTNKTKRSGFVSGTIADRAKQLAQEKEKSDDARVATSSSLHAHNKSVPEAKHEDMHSHIHSRPEAKLIEPINVKVLTYNLYWWNLFMQRHGNGGSASKLIRDAGSDEPFDVMGFQECVDPTLVLKEAGLAEEYDTVRFGRPTMTNNLCIAFKNSSWSLLDKGQATVGEDQKVAYYGERYVQWTRLHNKHQNRTLFFMTHQGPLPINTGGPDGGAAVAEHVLHQVNVHADPRDAVILLGDFNADTTSPTVQSLENRFKRVFTGKVNGGIDHIFCSKDDFTTTKASNLGKGGSDHDALSVSLKLKPQHDAADSTTDPEPARERTVVSMLK